MKNADDQDRIIEDTVEGKIGAGDQVPDAWRDVIPGDTGIGKIGELLPAAFYRVQDAIRRGRIVFRDMEPKEDQVVIGLSRPKDCRQNQSWLGSDALRRRRASALISAMEDRVLSPLSSPSWVSLRKSSTV